MKCMAQIKSLFKDNLSEKEKHLKKTFNSIFLIKDPDHLLNVKIYTGTFMLNSTCLMLNLFTTW